MAPVVWFDFSFWLCRAFVSACNSTFFGWAACRLTWCLKFDIFKCIIVDILHLVVLRVGWCARALSIMRRLLFI